MNFEDTRFKKEYSAALSTYLTRGGEDALARSYELGRRALAAGRGLIELMEIHQRAFRMYLAGDGMSADIQARISLEGQFLREAIASFEITHRGYVESTDAIRQTLQFGLVLGHELRAPLTSVKASAGMLKELLDDRRDATALKLVENIQAGAASLQERVDELVDLVGLQSGTFSIAPVPVEMFPLLRGICQRLEPEVAGSGIEFRVDIRPDLPEVRVDPERIEQVLSNLVQNAVKYAWEGKAIDLKAGVTGDRLEISVQDYGPGISAWDRTRVFQPFVRASQNGPKTHGLGVGLALCQAIVQGHGGTISLKSEEGLGTLITVSLPVMSSPVAVEGVNEGPHR